MKKTQAVSIASNLDSDKFTIEEKVEAIIDVAALETHNSVPKTTLVSSLRFMVELCSQLTSSLAQKEKNAK